MKEDYKTIQSILAGNKDEYEALVDRYYKGLNYHIYSMVDDTYLAEDICQEAFIKSYLALNRHNPAYSFSTWLYKIATNLALDYLKKARPLPLYQEIASTHVRIEEKMLIEERKAAVLNALQTLSPSHRAVVSLYYWQGKSYMEIAEILDVPINTVKTWLFRAKQIMKEKLDGSI